MVQAAISDLRLNQFGIEGVHAEGLLTIVAQVTAGDTMTIGTKTYTFISNGGTLIEGTIKVGTNLATCQANIIAAINGTDGVNTPNAEAFTNNSAFATNAIKIIARQPGATPTVATTSSFTNVGNLFDGATLGTTTAGSGGHGTSVAATEKAAVAFIDWEPTDEIIRPEFARGTIIRYKGNEVVVARGSKAAIPNSPVVLEQIQRWLAIAVKGGVKPQGSGPYTWIYDRPLVIDPQVDTMTIQRRLNDGRGYYVDNEFNFVAATKIGFNGAQKQFIQFTAELFGRRIQSTTFTPDLAFPSSPNIPVMSDSAIYIDDDWASLGNTQVLGQVWDWNHEFTTGLLPLILADGRSDRDFSGIVVSSAETQIAMSITMLIKPNGGSYATEKTKAESASLRAVRIKEQVDSNHQIIIDTLVKHTLGSLYKIGEQSGQDIVKMDFVEATDGVNFLKYTVINQVAA